MKEVQRAARIKTLKAIMLSWNAGQVEHIAVACRERKYSSRQMHASNATVVGRAIQHAHGRH